MARVRTSVWFFAVLVALTGLAIGIPYVYNLRQLLKPEDVAAARRRWDESGPADYDLIWRDKLEENTGYFRAELTRCGLTIKPGTHPIVPIMIGDAAKSQRFAARMLGRKLEDRTLRDESADRDRLRGRPAVTAA